MAAKDLIKLAERKGYSVGRNGKNRYYYSWVSKVGRNHEREFNGTFQQFAKFVKEL